MSNQTNVLSRIRVSHCPDAQSLLDTLSALTHLLNSGDSFAGSMKALIVDSLGSEAMLMNLPYVEGMVDCSYHLLSAIHLNLFHQLSP